MTAAFLPQPFAGLLLALVDIYVILIIIWAVISWFDHSKGWLRDAYGALNKIVGPYVGLFRRFIPPLGGIDLSPLIAVVVLQILVRLLA
ncbi:MAG: YggT family protein [Coriobacteriia bacterium]|nr:YggT family protein [Coriobacteriia bacterium]